MRLITKAIHLGGFVCKASMGERQVGVVYGGNREDLSTIPSFLSILRLPLALPCIVWQKSPIWGDVVCLPESPKGLLIGQFSPPAIQGLQLRLSYKSSCRDYKNTSSIRCLAPQKSHCFQWGYSQESAHRIAA